MTVSTPPGPIVRSYRAAILVPVPAGLTAEATPSTTAAPMPSLTYGDAFGHAPQPLGVGVVVGEQQGRRARPPRGGTRRAGDARRGPRSPPSTCADGCQGRLGRGAGPTTRCCGTRASAAGRAPPPRGRGWSTVIRIRMSSAAALAYSTTTSNSGRRRRRPYRPARTRDRHASARVLGDQLARRGMPAADSCSSALQVRVARGRVEVVVDLLDVLAVVALRPGQPEEPLLEDGIGAVPQRQGEAQPAAVVADAEQAVLAPAVRARTGVVVRERCPRRAVGGIVLADGAPLALGEIRTPAVPAGGSGGRLSESMPLRVQGDGSIHHAPRTPRLTVRDESGRFRTFRVAAASM